MRIIVFNLNFISTSYIEATLCSPFVLGIFRNIPINKSVNPVKELRYKIIVYKVLINRYLNEFADLNILSSQLTYLLTQDFREITS